MELDGMAGGMGVSPVVRRYTCGPDLAGPDGTAASSGGGDAEYRAPAPQGGGGAGSGGLARSVGRG